VTLTRAVAIVLAIAAAVVGIARGTWAVGGSDSSCYALMAQAFARGALQPVSALAAEAPWPNRGLMFAPGGFVPSVRRPEAASPVCAPGFSLLLAPLFVVGGRDAIFLLTPLAGGVLVYLVFMLGRQLAGGAAGLAAAIVLASAPVFVFQLVQPMNDILVAALWTAIVVLAAQHSQRAGWIGAVTGLVILIRPNLAPAVVPVAVWCCSAGVRQGVRFALGALPFAAVMLALNVALYGHPLQSGYGSAAALFSVANVGPNLVNYAHALAGTQLALPVIGLLAVCFAPPPHRRAVWLATATVSTILLIYFLYRPFAEWWYLRFLLPALAILTTLTMATLVWATRRIAVLIPTVGLVTMFATTSDAMRQALDLADLESRFRLAASTAADRLPRQAVFLTVWESGSVRYHAEREAVLWDAVDPRALDALLAWLEARGKEPYIMIEAWEENAFRTRFSAHSAVGGLDWPPRFDIDRRVKIYHPADRARYFAGETIPTEFVWRNRR
jgi:hypothetical protein